MNANESYSQKTRITLNVADVTIAQILDEIENTTEFKFIYSIKNVDLKRRVSINVEQLRIKQILRNLFNQTQTAYKVRGKQVILSKTGLEEIEVTVPPKEATIQQKITVKGQVLDHLSLPLAGVSIIEKGTSNGAFTDFDGNFEIEVAPEAILVFTYIGFNPQELIASTSFLSVSMKENVSELDEVIVVAQGISKSRKALGYAISQVDTKETENRAESDIARTLVGKISGVRIDEASGSSGSALGITIRGNLSLTGDNQALIVIDNVPSSAGLINVDPNDIKNITVLKGLNAAVLYGNLGRNGVILIETKSGNPELGKKRFDVSMSQVLYTNTAASLPDFQNKYGVGNNFVTDASSYENVGSHGAAFEDLDFIPHPLFRDQRFPEFANALVPYEAAKDNVNDFFKTGIGQVTSLNIRSTGENASFNFATNYTSEDGIIGTNNFKRFNISIGGTARISNKFRISSSLSYITRHRNRQTSSIFDALYLMPRSLDIHSFPFQDSEGRNVYYNRNTENPLWTINNTGDDLITNRLVGVVNLDYAINKNHNIKYRGGLQTNNFSEFSFRNKGGIGDTAQFGSLDLTSNETFTIDNSIVLSSNYKLSKTIGLDSQFGINSRFRRTTSLDSEYTDQIVYNYFRPNNFRTVGQGDYDTTRSNLVGIFGQLDFDYKNYLFLNVSGRYDVSSVVEKENQTLFYPGVSVSFVPTSAFKNFKSKYINYLKLRGAFATSSGFPDLYDTRTALSSNPREFDDPEAGLLVTNSLFSNLANPNLKPELHREFELGLEGKFFNNTITLEASVFSRISRNQIFNTQISPDTGFDSTVINAGRLDSQGIEIDLGFDLFKNSEFNWNMRNTFTSFKTDVVELANGIQQLIGRHLKVGEELGVFFGDYVVRDSEGNALVNPIIGEILESSDIGLNDRIIGNTQPDFRLSNIQTLNYKNFSLSAQFEYTHGGQVLSTFAERLIERGLTTDTENREGSFIIPGVLGDPVTGEPILDDNGNTIPNTIQVTANRFALGNYFNPNEHFTYDASVFRIREIALGYTLDKTNFKKLPFESLVMTLSGRNIFYHAPDIPSGTNVDPEVPSRTVPTTKRYSFSIAVNF
ncbi:SusC/RagA family TonB-linked outer membrane protein [Flavivirga amylovorans]